MQPCDSLAGKCIRATDRRWVLLTDPKREAFVTLAKGTDADMRQGRYRSLHDENRKKTEASHMSVPVIGQNGMPLMPTTERKARILLKNKRAEVICRHPFAIRLLYKTGCAAQSGSIGIDTGARHIGVGITCGNRVILKAEHTLRSSMEKRTLIQTRAE